MTIHERNRGLSFDQVRAELAPYPLRATSAGRDWEGVSLDEYGDYHMAGERFMAPRDHHIVTISLGYSALVVQERLGRTFTSPSLPGEVTMMPAGYETRFQGLLPGHIRIGLMPDRLVQAAESWRRIGTQPRADLLSNFRARDPWLDHLGALLSLELGRAPHPGQDMLIESLSLALSVHLVRNYSADAGNFDNRAAGAARSSVRRALDYMRDRGNEKISLAELADAAGVSRFHLVKLFTREMGISPMKYLEASRIEQAKAMIRSSHLPLADIAYAVGFADQSHFTRRFRHHAGCTPAAYGREHGRGRPPER